MGLRSFGTEIRYKIIPLFLNLRIPDPGFHLYSVRGLVTLDTRDRSLNEMVVRHGVSGGGIQMR